MFLKGHRSGCDIRGHRLGGGGGGARPWKNLLATSFHHENILLSENLIVIFFYLSRICQIGLFLTNSTSVSHKLKVFTIIYLRLYNLFHKK
jgi:hypothetical protein